MAIYLKWHMCSCHEPLVAQISGCYSCYCYLLVVVMYLYTNAINSQIRAGCILDCDINIFLSGASD